MQIIRAKAKAAPGKKVAAATKPVAAKAAPSVPKVMAKYNRSLDLVALALSLGAKGKSVQAAKVFASAINHHSCASAINVINASNQVALHATKLQAAKMRAAEGDENELSDEELDQLLGDGSEPVQAETEEDEGTEGEDFLEDNGDGAEGDEEEDMAMEDEDDAGDGTDMMAKVLARLTKK